jgi:hypothetical protein
MGGGNTLKMMKIWRKLGNAKPNAKAYKLQKTDGKVVIVAIKPPGFNKIPGNSGN